MRNMRKCLTVLNEEMFRSGDTKGGKGERKQPQFYSTVLPSRNTRKLFSPPLRIGF
jgi:hypothetical protein